MKKIKIYKVTCTKGWMASCETGTGYSLDPWKSNIDYEGYDDGGQAYWLPDNIEIALDQTHYKGFWDKKTGSRYFLDTDRKTGGPILVGAKGIIKLEKCEGGLITYREYARSNGHNDKQIENMVDGLFGADTEMIFEKNCEGGALYNMGNGYKLYVMNSTYDVCVMEDEDGKEIEAWNLEY